MFSEENSGDNTGDAAGKFQERWGWFGIMHRLCNMEIVNLDRVTKLSLLECLTWLCYETDLNENQKVKKG